VLTPRWHKNLFYIYLARQVELWTHCGVAVSYTPTASYARICFCRL